jgi:hypothetical protein
LLLDYGAEGYGTGLTHALARTTTQIPPLLQECGL